MGRLLAFALISEIPFNFMTGGGWLYPYHQNVLWTFLIAIICMIGIDKMPLKHGGALATQKCQVTLKIGNSE